MVGIINVISLNSYLKVISKNENIHIIQFQCSDTNLKSLCQSEIVDMGWTFEYFPNFSKLIHHTFSLARRWVIFLHSFQLSLARSSLWSLFRWVSGQHISYETFTSLPNGANPIPIVLLWRTIWYLVCYITILDHLFFVYHIHHSGSEHVLKFSAKTFLSKESSNYSSPCVVDHVSHAYITIGHK